MTRVEGSNRRRSAAMTLACVASALCFTVPLAPHSRSFRKELTRAQLLHALDCLTRDGTQYQLGLTDLPDPLKIRYWYGIHDPNVDTRDSLKLLIYYADGKEADLYEMTLVRSGDCEHFFVGNIAEFRRNGKDWEVSDTLGGEYTRERLAALIDALEQTPAVNTPQADIEKSCAVCAINRNQANIEPTEPGAEPPKKPAKKEPHR